MDGGGFGAVGVGGGHARMVEPVSSRSRRGGACRPSLDAFGNAGSGRGSFRVRGRGVCPADRPGQGGRYASSRFGKGCGASGAFAPGANVGACLHYHYAKAVWISVRRCGPSQAGPNVPCEARALDRGRSIVVGVRRRGGFGGRLCGTAEDTALVLEGKCRNLPAQREFIRHLSRWGSGWSAG